MQQGQGDGREGSLLGMAVVTIDVIREGAVAPNDVVDVGCIRGMPTLLR